MKKKVGFHTKAILIESCKEALFRLSPMKQIQNPVIFVTYLGAIFTTFLTVQECTSFHVGISFWLWMTVLFSNFSSALAENRGKAQALSLRRLQQELSIVKIVNGVAMTVSIADLKKGDSVVCSAGDLIPLDGEVIEGVATVDESAITGESAPVIRESGGDRSAVTAGTKVVSDQIVIKITSDQGQSFLDKIIKLIEGAKRQKTPNEIALNIILSAVTLIFLLNVFSLKFFSTYSSSSSIGLPELIALLVCLIPTTISGLLSAIGIAGMQRLVQCNVVAKSGRAIEAAGDVDILLLDKTGTITPGNRVATEFLPVSGVQERELAEVAQLASLADETPEGRSIVVLAKNKFNFRAESLSAQKSHFIPFSAQTRMSGVDLLDDSGTVIKTIRKGSIDSIRKRIEELGGVFSDEIYSLVVPIANKGGTPLLVSVDNKIMGVVHLKDIVKGGIRKRFSELRHAGIKTIMITGDNPLTAGAIAAEAGVDDFIAEATPEMKLNCIREAQSNGHLIAMTGDGTNDAPALAQADVGVAMNTGTQASREAGNMVDLDSNPAKLIDIIKVGKQLLMTRGALTTFSMANDVAKYFAIIPAIFSSLYSSGEQEGPLQCLNIMGLYSKESAILSAVIFNAVVIIALLPLALNGVAYKVKPAVEMLRFNLLIYGLGGIITPFIGIKLIDICMRVLP